MNKTYYVLRHCCAGEKWWDHNKPNCRAIIQFLASVFNFIVKKLGHASVATNIIPVANFVKVLIYKKRFLRRVYMFAK